MYRTAPVNTMQAPDEFKKTMPTFETIPGRKSLLFPEELNDVKVGGLKSKIDVEMSFMKVIFSQIFVNNLYGAGIKDCKLVRYDYKREKLVCRSRLSIFDF